MTAAIGRNSHSASSEAPMPPSRSAAQPTQPCRSSRRCTAQIAATCSATKQAADQSRLRRRTPRKTLIVELAERAGEWGEQVGRLTGCVQAAVWSGFATLGAGFSCWTPGGGSHSVRSTLWNTAGIAGRCATVACRVRRSGTISTRSISLLPPPPTVASVRLCGASSNTLHARLPAVPRCRCSRRGPRPRPGDQAIRQDQLAHCGLRDPRHDCVDHGISPF